jgi:hypothetical protein
MTPWAKADDGASTIKIDASKKPQTARRMKRLLFMETDYEGKLNAGLSGRLNGVGRKSSNSIRSRFNPFKEF